MKVTIETDDIEEIQTLMNATNFQSVLCDFGNYLRLMALGKTTTVDDIDKIYERFFEIINDHGINRDIIGF